MAAPVVISRGAETLNTRNEGIKHDNGPASAFSFGITPSGKHIATTSPGGSRITYSLDELLSLAASPLSRMSASTVPVPSEISRSPEQRSGFAQAQAQALATGPPLAGAPASPTSTFAPQSAYIAQAPTSPTTKIAASAATPRSFRKASIGQGAAAFGRTRAPSASSTSFMSTSPTASRSPGNAFDFAKGPMGGAGLGASSCVDGAPSLGSTPAAFKERLAAASVAARDQQQRRLAHKGGDVQFAMEM